MPVFEYTGYHNPYGPSIAEALGHQGDVQASLALQQGAIAAQAARDRGQLWSGIADTVGNTAAAIPRDQLAARKQALVDQQAQQQIALGGLQLDAAKREQRTRNVFEAELQNPANYNEDGTINDARLVPALQKQDVGAWQQYVGIAAKNTQARLELQKTLSEIGKNVADAGEKQQKFSDAQQAYLGKSALAGYAALQQKPDDPLHARDTANAFVADAIASGAINQSAGRSFLLQTAKAGPDQLAATFLQFADPELRSKIDKERAEAARPINVAPGGTLVTPPTPGGAGGAVVYTAPPEVKAGTPEDWVTRARRLAVDQNGGVPLTDAQLQTVDTAALQSFKASNVDPEMRDAALAQKNIAQMLAQANLNQRPTPEQAAAVADDLVNHRLAPEQLASLFSTRGAEGLAFKLAVGAEAKKLDPGFNWQEASSNYQLVKSPGFQNTVRYIDSVQESMPRLLQNARTLGNGQFTSLNQLANAAASQFSDTDLKRLRTDAVLVGDEVAKLLAGGGSGSATSDAKLKQGMDLINTADSVPAMAAALDEINTLVGFRRKALTRGTYLEGTSAGAARQPTMTAPPSAAAPQKGTIRQLGTDKRMYDGEKWVPVK